MILQKKNTNYYFVLRYQVANRNTKRTIMIIDFNVKTTTHIHGCGTQSHTWPDTLFGVCWIQTATFTISSMTVHGDTAPMYAKQQSLSISVFHMSRIVFHSLAQQIADHHNYYQCRSNEAMCFIITMAHTHNSVV